ncbi:hypothetical protein [Aeromicrobium fastidiosum]|uniref:Uncharacterized protein n=1 Tax=Aeromicrobium fastidiosum TaxID=52699 RepID=A0A641ALR6_9ACTN|nr:hypothetical protein [Aeromicrobium fastidiosum]KAA1378218.1 hypothetical protein ESP62_007505 [Aeromicrobium fastidiosum]MBP2388972.1 hypothetical protein [Aeromicrobium fastidiosum]
MTMSQAEKPEVVFALPGEWVRVGLDDESQVAELTRLLDGATPDPTSWIASTKALGGVLLMFRIRSEPSVGLLFAWPPGEETGDPSRAGVQSRLGAEGELIEHAAEYACVRTRSGGGSAATDVLTYGVVHPESGRLLLVRVTAFDGPFDELDVEDYDLSVSRMSWEELDV